MPKKEARIPLPLLRWLISSRQRLLDALQDGAPFGYLPAHLPVLATWRRNAAYPVNLTVKGMGLFPRPALVPFYARLFEETLAEASRIPWDKSLPLRVAAHRRLYSRPENFDRRLLGGLEIFGRATFRNISADPRASLLYFGLTASGPRADYISCQLNGRVDVLSPDNENYRFLLAARNLFEFDKFHLPQPDYPWAYLFRVEEVRDKSPRIKDADPSGPRTRLQRKPAG